MAAASGWESYELVWPDGGGDYSSPVSDALGQSGDAIRMLKLMSRVEELGWKEAQKLRIGGQKAKRRIVKKDDDVYLLKGTPLCWRLYFYVREENKHFVYVHAVCKKRDAEDPGDHETAKQHFDRRANGNLAEIRFPS
jgi:hypothetical protein